MLRVWQNNLLCRFPPMATGMAKIPYTKNKVFDRSVPTRGILEGPILNLCVYFIRISCGTSMGGKGLLLEGRVFLYFYCLQKNHPLVEYLK